MTAQVLIAPPAAGKTSACARRIIELHERRPLAPVRVVVRDHLQIAAFRARLNELGGAFNVAVETFESLYQEILWRGEDDVRPTATLALRLAAMQASIERSALEYLEPLQALPGFTRTVYDRVSVLQRAAVTPGQLEEIGTPLLRDLAKLYGANQKILADSGWVNPDGLAGLALAQLERCPGLLADLALLVVDGFDFFEPAQCRVLGCLAGRVQQLLVTLPGQPVFQRPAHRLFLRSFEELTRCASFEIVTLDSSPRLPAALAYLEAGLQQPQVEALSADDGSVEMIEARSAAEEAREALRWLKKQIVRRRTPPGRCAVLAPKPDLYAPFLRQAADEFGLPLRIYQGRRLADTPVISALLNLTGLPAGGFPGRALLDVLRSPFFDFTAAGLDRRQVEQLDIIRRYGKVIEGLEQWEEVFASLVEQQVGEQASESLEMDEGTRPPELPRGEPAAGLREVFCAVTGRFIPPDGRQGVSEWVAWLEALLADCGFYPEEDETVDLQTRAALLALRGCLQGLLAAEQALAAFSARQLNYEEFTAQLQSLLENTDVADPDDPGAVRVFSPLEVRGLRFEAAAVLGLSEGIFPWVERPDPLLGEEVRARLGMPARLEQEQLGLFYQLVTRADRALLLTRPYLADKGEPQEASPYWNEVVRLLPGRARTFRPTDHRPLAEAASPDEALFWARLQGAALDGRYAGLQPRQALADQAGDRLAALAGAALDSAGTAAQADLAKVYMDGRVWSVTSLETYASCPFRFFVEALLAVEGQETPAWDFDALQMGSLLHAILEHVYQGAEDMTGTGWLLDRLASAAREEFDQAPARYGFRPSPLWKLMQADLQERLEDTVRRLAEISAGYRPVAGELRFGSDHQPFEIQAGRHAVRLRGMIDRVDQDEAGQLRVIDYKAGGSHLHMNDLQSGRRLQLPVYALAAAAVYGGEVAEGLYYRIGKEGDKNVCRLSRLAEGDETPGQAARRVLAGHLERIFDRLEQGIFHPAPLEGECPSYCACAGWCWQYNPA